MSRELRTENAIIESTFLGINDHGIFDAWLHTSGDGWGCGFGGYSLDGPITVKGKFSHREDTHGLVGEYVRQVLETVGVDSWEKLKGQHIRVVTEGLGGGIVAIGNLIKDKWFTPKEWFSSRLDCLDD
jgi:hypothetical protein